MKLWIGEDSGGNRITQASVDESKAYCEEAYGAHGIGFNWCEEVLVDNALFNDPRLFLSEINCSIEFDPHYLHVYLVEECPPSCGDGTTGQANAVGGNRGYSEPKGTLAHELAHMMNLEHFGGCPSDLPSDWSLGDSLGDPLGDPATRIGSRDYVTDTPIVPRHETDANNNIVWPKYQIDNPATPEDEGCWVDWSLSIGLCGDGNGNAQQFPTNYGYKLDGQGNMFYDPIWETNVMSGFNSGNCRGFVRNFTPGQAERMKWWLDNEHTRFVDNSNPDCPVRTFDAPLLTQTLLDSGVPLTGDYRVEDNLIVSNEVIFQDANISIKPGRGIIVRSSGTLSATGSSFDTFFSCGDNWIGFVVEPEGEIMMNNVDIINAYKGIDLASTEINLDFVTFLRCDYGMDIHYNSTSDNIFLTDCNFIESKMNIVDSTIKLDGTRCSESEINSSSTTGDHRLFISIGNGVGRPTFMQSNVVTNNLDFFGLANCYFDEFSDVEVKKGNRVDICWSLFDKNISGPLIDMSLDPDFVEAGVNNYKIYGNQFVNNQNNIAILAGNISSDQSIIRNNIFTGSISPNSFDSGTDNFVEISCNYCKNEISTPFKTASGMQDQGRDDHPAGNKFYFNKLIAAATEFNYYYNFANPALEEPVGAIFTIPADYLIESVCLSEQEILDEGNWDVFLQNPCSLDPNMWNEEDYACFCPAPPNPGPDPINPIEPNPNQGGGIGDNGIGGMIVQEGYNHALSKIEEEIVINNTSDRLTIRRVGNDEEIMESLQVQLFSISAQVLLNRRVIGTTFVTDLSQLDSGVYILNVSSDSNAINYNRIIHHQQ